MISKPNDDLMIIDLSESIEGMGMSSSTLSLVHQYNEIKGDKQ